MDGEDQEDVSEKPGWELFQEIFSPSTSASTRLGIVLQIVSSGINWSTVLCSSRCTPSRRRTFTDKIQN